MILNTQRLILRPWSDTDAQALYEYAKDPDIGPIAGWPPHKNIDESRYIISTFQSRAQCYAICFKDDGKPIGCIELKLKGYADLAERDDECELGYWLGKPFWGQGIMPEAAKELIRYAFDDLGMTTVWCAYYEGNAKSMRVQEKLGFRFRWRSEGVDVPLMHEKRNGYVNSITREEWLSDYGRKPD